MCSLVFYTAVTYSPSLPYGLHHMPRKNIQPFLRKPHIPTDQWYDNDLLLRTKPRVSLLMLGASWLKVAATYSPTGVQYHRRKRA